MKPSPLQSTPMAPADPTLSPPGKAWRPSNYHGTHCPLITEPTNRAKLASYRRQGSGLFAEIIDGGARHCVYLAHVDHPELMRLGDRDRATLQGALVAIRREIDNV